MWPSVRSRLPAYFSESFRTTLCLGEAERNKKKKDLSAENLACVVQPEPSASIGINFAAAASSLRENKLPLRYVTSFDTTPLSEAVSLGDEAHKAVATAHTPEKSASDTVPCHVTSSCSRTTPLVKSLKQNVTSKKEETKPQIRSRSNSSDEEEVKYSRTLEFLLKTNFEVTPTSSSQEIVDDSANVSSTKKKVPVKVKEGPSLEELLTINTKPQQKSIRRKAVSQKEIRKARRRELNKIHAKNYREKIKAEKETVSSVLSNLEEKNEALRKRIKEMEEKKQWLTSYINMATQKKTEALKKEQRRQQEEEQKKREEEESLALDIEELFGSILSSQASFTAYEVMEIE